MANNMMSMEGKCSLHFVFEKERKREICHYFPNALPPFLDKGHMNVWHNPSISFEVLFNNHDFIVIKVVTITPHCLPCPFPIFLSSKGGYLLHFLKWLYTLLFFVRVLVVEILNVRVVLYHNVCFFRPKVGYSRGEMWKLQLWDLVNQSFFFNPVSCVFFLLENSNSWPLDQRQVLVTADLSSCWLSC